MVSTENFAKIKKFVYWMLFERLTVKFASALITTTNLEQEHFEPFLSPAALSKKIRVIPLGIEDLAAKSTQKRKSANSTNTKRILFISRIHPKKCLDDLLHAISNLDFDIKLVVAGDGDYRYVNDLKALAKRQLIEDKIEWVGHITNEKKLKHFWTVIYFVYRPRKKILA